MDSPSGESPTGAGSPSPSAAALGGSTCGSYMSASSAGRSGAGATPGPLERAGRAPCPREVQRLPAGWQGPEVRTRTRVHTYTCSRAVCVRDCARADGAEAHPPCGPQRRGAFSRWVLCALRRPWAMRLRSS